MASAIHDNTNMQASVELATQMLFLDEQHPDRTLPAVLSYDASAPFEVSVTFDPDTVPVTWCFARDLLRQGVFAPAGEGDLRIWPCLDSDGKDTVVFELRSGCDPVLIGAPAPLMIEFLERSLAVVPAGEESSYLDLDSALNALLA